ncbi:MAG: HK97 family phage prohead protease, partial [Pseudomonadota bacterium]
MLSDETVDRDGDIIRAAGWQLESFLKNAPLLAFHDPRQPIGSWEDVRVEGTRLIGRAKFAAAGTVPLADQLFSLYADGHLKAVSVGFEIIEAIPLIVDDVRRGFEILKAGLLEASLVTIPSNPNALQRMQSKMAKAYKDGDEANAAALARIVKAADEVAGDSEGDEKADDGEKAEKAEAGDSFTTSSEEGHSHEFTVGSATTELAGDPPHVHALTDPGGEQPLVIEEAEGHTHTAPDAAFVTLEEDEEAGAEADDERGKAMETAQRLFREIGERQTELGDIMARLEGKQPGDAAASKSSLTASTAAP